MTRLASLLFSFVVIGSYYGFCGTTIERSAVAQSMSTCQPSRILGGPWANAVWPLLHGPKSYSTARCLPNLLNGLVPGSFAYPQRDPTVVTTAIVSPDNRFVLGGLKNGYLFLCVLATGEVRWSIQAHSPAPQSLGQKGLMAKVPYHAAINAVDFSPNGQRAISAGVDNTIRLCDIATGKMLWSVVAHTDYISSVTFSPDGNSIVSASADKTISLWRADTGKKIHTFAGHQDAITSVAFSHNGKRVVSGSWDRTLKLWEIGTGKNTHTFSAHTEPVYSVQFAPGDQYVLSAGGDNSVKVWQINTGKVTHSFVPVPGAVGTTPFFNVAFSKTGFYILISGPTCGVHLREKLTGTVALRLQHPSAIYKSAVFSADNKYILTYGVNSLVLWDSRTGEIAQTLVDTTVSRLDLKWVGFAPDGQHVFSLDSGSNLKKWNVKTRKWVSSVTDVAGRKPTLVALAPDGKRLLATFGPDGDQTPEDRGEFRLLDLQGKTIQSFRGHTIAIYALSFSADGNLILSAGADRTSKLWDSTNGKLIRSFAKPDGDWVYLVALSHDGKLGASAPPAISVWDLSTGKPLWEVKEEAPSFAILSPNGKLLVTGGQSAKLWDSATGKLVSQIESEVISPPSPWVTAAFSPSGKEILLSNEQGSLQLRDVETGKLLQGFVGKALQQRKRALAFSADGRLAVSAGDCHALQLWDIKTGEEVWRISGP